MTVFPAKGTGAEDDAGFEVGPAVGEGVDVGFDVGDAVGLDVGVGVGVAAGVQANRSDKIRKSKPDTTHSFSFFILCLHKS